MVTRASEGETIVAVSSPRGRGAVSLLRISGDLAKRVGAVGLGLEEHGLEPRRVRLGFFRNGKGETLDQVLLTYFRRPNSYTGEDLVEISCHGSPVVVSMVLERCLEMGARMARPGEFTLRAFLNGKLDLIQAEAVADLIQAETRHQARAAERRLEGELSRQLQPVRLGLMEVVASLETSLEFVEDEVEPEDAGLLAARVTEASMRLKELAASYEVGRLLQEGLRIVIAGRPNSGKSCLFNSLLENQRAIVTEIAGTTRDSLREWMEIDGIPVCLVDTAGLGRSWDGLEQKGVERSQREVKDADLVLFVLDRGEPLTEEDHAAREAIQGKPFLLVLNKCDLESRVEVPAEWLQDSLGAQEVSALTGEGMGRLRKTLLGAWEFGGELGDEGVVVTSLRQKECLVRARKSAEDGCKALQQGLSEEFVVEDLRRSLEELAELTGETRVEEILDSIFSRFCIGK